MKAAIFDMDGTLGATVAWIAFLICGLTDYPSAAPAINYTLAVLAGLMVADIRPGNG